METTHIQKNLVHSPRKMKLVADMVRKLNPSQALVALNFTPQSAAKDLAKAIKTAIANAKIAGVDLRFKKLEVNEGFKMKRFRAAPRGRARPYIKRTSQVKIVLTDEILVNPQEQKNHKKEGVET